MSRISRYLTAVALLSITPLSCDGVNDPVDSCPEDKLSPSLKPVFYWGQTSDPGTWELNKGIPIGSGRFTQWLDADHLVSSSGTFSAGNMVNGLLVLSLAPDGVTVNNWELFAFEPEIWYMRVFHSTGEIWLLYYESDAALYPRLSRVALAAGTVQIEETILDESWEVGGVADWGDGSTALVHATRPSDLKKGFFTVTTAALATDSLVYGINMTSWSARGFDLAHNRKNLYWGDVIDSWENAITLVHCLDLTSEPLQPIVVAARPGGVIGLAVHPVDPNYVLVNRRVYESASVVKEDVVELLDVRDGSTQKLDVKTSVERCYAIRNEFPAWRADGSAMLFRSWAASSGSQSRVWLREIGP